MPTYEDVLGQLGAKLDDDFSAITTPPDPEPPEPDDDVPAGYRVVFVDDFSGSSVDRSQWNVRTDTQNNHNGKNMVENAVVHDDMCDLTCTRLATPVSGKPYGTAYLDTIGKPSGAQRYGRWEVDCVMPKAKGAWPAFWLRDNSSGGECDVIEAVRDGKGGGYLVMTMHQDTMGGGQKRGFEWRIPEGWDWNAVHRFAVDWDGTTMVWLVDDVEATRITTAQISWLSGCLSGAGMNIRLNYQAGGSMPDWYKLPMDSTSVLPDIFSVRRVRILERVPARGRVFSERDGFPRGREA